MRVNAFHEFLWIYSFQKRSNYTVEEHLLLAPPGGIFDRKVSWRYLHFVASLLLLYRKYPVEFFAIHHNSEHS